MQVFRDVITIKQDGSNAGDNDPDYTGAAFASDVPCRVVDVRGLEKYHGNQLVANVDFMIEMWEYPGILPSMRVVVDGGIHAGKTMGITHVQDKQIDGKPKMTALYCTERTL